MPFSRVTSRSFSIDIVSVVCVCALALAQLYTLPASAEESGENEPPSSFWALGIGAMNEQKPYSGMDRDTDALPLIQFENEYLQVFGPTIGLKLPSLDLGEAQKLNFSLVGEYDGSGYEDDDAKILEGMSKRKGGFWAGGKVEWNSDLVDVNAEWLADASGNSKGQRLALGLEKTWHFGNHVMLTPRLVASWHDKKYVDYYFGVRDNEVRADRAAYKGKSGISSALGARGIYMFDRTHSVFMDAEVSSLASSIKDSPLVDRSSTNSLLLGYLYRF